MDILYGCLQPNDVCGLMKKLVRETNKPFSAHTAGVVASQFNTTDIDGSIRAVTAVLHRVK